MNCESSVSFFQNHSIKNLLLVGVGQDLPSICFNHFLIHRRREGFRRFTKILIMFSMVETGCITMDFG